jgi:hypothetical protein
MRIQAAFRRITAWSLTSITLSMQQPYRELFDRAFIVAMTAVLIGCGGPPADTTKTVSDAKLSSIKNDSLQLKPGSVPARRVEETGATHGTAAKAAEVAAWRGSPNPDRIDTLMAAAFSTTGEFEGGEDEYGFTGNESAVEALRLIPEAIPRLVACLTWERRASATWEGIRVPVGVICYQAIAGSSYVQLLNKKGAALTGGYVDYRNPSMASLRRAQEVWRDALRVNPL